MSGAPKACRGGTAPMAARDQIKGRWSVHRPISAEGWLLRVMGRIGEWWLSRRRTRSTLVRALGFGFLRFRLHVGRLSRRGAGRFRLRLEPDLTLRGFAL